MTEIQLRVAFYVAVAGYGVGIGVAFFYLPTWAVLIVVPMQFIGIAIAKLAIEMVT